MPPGPDGRNGWGRVKAVLLAGYAGICQNAERPEGYFELTVRRRSDSGPSSLNGEVAELG